MPPMPAESGTNQRSIRVLPASLANKIAAGEVVERPASVVKELVENSIDAGSTSITVEIHDGGKEFIRVTDNGVGIEPEEIPLAVLRHATSKIATAEDLVTVGTLGFRGEALPSIASCSEVEIISRTKRAEEASSLVIKAGQPEPLRVASGPPGTTVIVRRLFYNTPARYKFLKTTATEKRYVAEYIAHMALAHPRIAFRLVFETGTILSTPGKSDLLAAFAAVHSAELARQMIPASGDAPFVSLSGFISPPSQNRHNRNHMSIFVNGRWVQNRLLYAAVEKGYDTMLPARRFPIVVLHLGVNPSLVDVNVHPAKTEIRFRHESETFKNVMLAIKDSLSAANLVQPRHKSSYIPSTMPSVGPAREPRQSEHESRLVPDIRYPERLPFSSAVAVKERLPKDKEVAPLNNVRYANTNYQRSVSQAVGTGINVELVATSDIPGLHEHMQEAIAPAPPPPESEAVREFLRNTPVLGQVLQTYLVLPAPEGLWLVDQHVAHERILYEQVLAKPEARASQLLLEPASVELSASEATLLEEALGELGELGFVVEPFGGTSYLVRAVPVNLAGSPNTALIRELVAEIAEGWEVKGPNRKEKAAAMIACKAAIKAGQRLVPETQKALVTSLAKAINPFACPHGRPIVIAIDHTELARRFGRQ